MSTKSDTQIQQEVETRFREVRIPLDVDVSDGIARVTGYVDSDADYQAAMDILASVEGIIEVNNEIEISTTAPDAVSEEPSSEQGYEFTETPNWAGDDDEVPLDPDLTEEPETTSADFQESVEEGQPYFPPTDPVVRPSDDEEDLEVTGGWQDTSMEELADEPELDTLEEESPGASAVPRDDETIREDVERELREDSTTSSLDLDIEVANGVIRLRGNVGSIDDALNAEDVAGRVPGVVAVRDETTLEQ